MFVLVFVSCCAERLRSIDVQWKLTTTSSVEFASVNLKRFPWFRTFPDHRQVNNFAFVLLCDWQGSDTQVWCM